MAPLLLETNAAAWRREPALREEAFGPGALLVRYRDAEDLLAALEAGGGQLTGTIHAGKGDSPELVQSVTAALERLAGRVVFDGYPTGVEVCPAMVHGGPYPATSAPATTSVGALAVRRFARPVAWQNAPDAVLPPELRDANPLGIQRTVAGRLTREAVRRMALK